MFKNLSKKLFITLVSVASVSTAFSTETITPDNDVNQVPKELIYTVVSNTSISSTALGGVILPIKMVKLIAQMPGEVKFVAGEEGDAFLAGEKLVGLDPSTLLEKRRAALAGLNSAKAGLSNARVQFQRESESPNAMSNSMLGGAPSMFSMFGDPMRSFSGQGNPSFERYSSMYGQSVKIQTSKNKVEQAMAGISELNATLNNLNSIAPFKGIIVNKMVEVGDIVQPGMPLVVFADTSLMQVQVEVPARLVSGLNKDSIVSAKLDGKGDLVTVKVARIFPMANLGGHTTTVKFQLPKGTSARAGMYAEILIPNKNKTTKPLALIPQSAISWRGSLPAVFLISDDKSQLTMRSLRLGSATKNNMIKVLSGISIGDEILKAPTPSTRSGAYTVPFHNNLK